MIDDTVFQDLIKKIVELYSGEVTLVLFGSRARGDHWPSSDYDIMVFLSEVNDPAREATRILSLKRGTKLSLDVVVKEKGELNDPITRKMLKDRVVLFDGLRLFSGDV